MSPTPALTAGGAAGRARARGEVGSHHLVAEACHELRTPIASILSAAELALVADAGTAPDYLEIIRRNAERLDEAIEDLLLVERLEAGAVPFAPRPVEVATLVGGVVADLAPVAGRRGVTLVHHADPACVVRADEGGVGRIVANLLGNAVKFTREGTTVEVREDRRGEGWSISVRDEGPGVPPGERAAVFDRFYRSPRTGRDTCGSGLGLAIVRAHVERHHGRTGIDDAPGGGAVAWCWLPIDPRRTAGAGAGGGAGR